LEADVKMGKLIFDDGSIFVVFITYKDGQCGIDIDDLPDEVKQKLAQDQTSRLILEDGSVLVGPV